MVHIETVQDTIADSIPEEWLYFSELGTWTCTTDVKLRVQRHDQLDPNFQSPWTQGIQAGCQSYRFHVYYGNSPIESHVIVSVDNFRAHIPAPQQPVNPNEPYTLTPYRAKLGRIITGDDQTFEAYLNRTGIEIR